MGQHSRYGMGEERWDSGLEEFVYNSIEERISLPKDEFMEQLKEWELKPVELDGVLTAVVMVKDNEVHVAVREGYKGRWMKRGSVIRGILAPILDKYGEIVTRAEFDNFESRAFIERLGFVPSTVFYRLDQLKHR